MSLGLGVGYYGLGGQDMPLFTLTDVGSLSLWLKNDTAVGTAKWEDSSGNSNHALQSSEANQAAVSGGGLDFESNNSAHYDLTSSIAIGYRGGFCMAIVFQRESTNAHAMLSDTSNEILQLQGNTTTFRFRTNTGSEGAQNITTDAVFPAGTFDSGQKMLFLVNRSIGTSNVFTFMKNGAALTADTDTSANEATGENPNGFDFDTLGAREGANFFDGIIYELAFWSKGLSTGEIADVNSYLKEIHGI